MAKPRTHIKVFDFVLFSNLFIACCAVAMAWFTTSIFNTELSVAFTGFIFFSTLASYSIHWYLTDEHTESTAQRTKWLSANKKTHIVFFIVSVVGSGSFLLAEFHNLVWIMPAVFLTVLYSVPKIPLNFFSKLKQRIWGKTILLAAMWAYVTAVLPLLVQPIHWHSVHSLYCINRLLLIFPICILFDQRDKEYDTLSGVKSIITLLHHTNVKKIFTVAIISNLVTAAILYTFFRDVLFVAILAIPAVLTYFLYSRANKTLNDYLFYFILDGLMALSPIMYLLKNYRAI